MFSVGREHWGNYEFGNMAGFCVLVILQNNNYKSFLPFRTVSPGLPVRSVRISMFLEKSVIKVSSLVMYESLSQKEKILKLKNTYYCMFTSCKNVPQLFEKLLSVCLSVCLSVQSVTVTMECVMKVQRVMDSVCVSHRTLESAVTKVRP